ncbi:MAG: PspC domain-containing protein [Dermatophilus congolensis]|nr:PspC domain-containing protein [Dermatophilus congolensis]
MSGHQSSQPQQTPDSGSSLDRFSDAMRGTGIIRPLEGRVLGGVCLGVGRRYNVDPVLLRVGFVVASLFLGMGLLLYVAATLVLPDAEGRVAFVRAVRERDSKSIALVALFVMLLLTPSFDGDGASWMRSIVSVAIAGAIVALILNRPNRGAPVAGPPAPAASESAQRTGGLVFDPESGGWKPSDNVRGEGAPGAGGTAPQPFAPTAPPSRPAYVPPAPISPAEIETQRAARRHRRLVSLTTVAFAVVVYTLAYLVLRAAGSVLDAQLAFATTLAALGLVSLVSGARRVRNRAAVGLVIGGLALSPLMATADWNVSADNPVFGGVSEGAGTVSFVPTSAEQLAQGQRLGVGEMTVDLTRMSPAELQALDNHPLDLSLGMGDMTLIVPASASIRVQPQVGMGDVSVIDLRDPAGNTSDSATGGNQAPIQLGMGSPDVVVTADIGMGALKIERR